MIFSFKDSATRDIYDGVNRTKSRKALPQALRHIARRKLDMLDAAFDINDLRIPPSNRLETLKGSLKGKYSIRINDQYRIVFSWTPRGAEDVEVTDDH